MLLKAFLTGAAMLLVGPAYAQQAPAEAPAPAETSNLSPAQFATQAGIGNIFELESSALAPDKSQNQDVLAFATQMTTDHSKAAQDMMTAATEEGVTPPSELDQAHQATMDELTSAEGEDFDAAYIAAQVKAHDDAVSLFETYSTNGPEGALKDFAAATLPTLKMHQEHIHQLAGN